MHLQIPPVTVLAARPDFAQAVLQPVQCHHWSHSVDEIWCPSQLEVLRFSGEEDTGLERLWMGEVSVFWLLLWAAGVLVNIKPH